MTAQVYSFAIDLKNIALDESSTQTWIQAFPYGTYEHPAYGTIEMNAERAARMAANVKSKVRGIDLDIDYDHKMHGGEAAGWVKDADARSDGLWLLVDWTNRAYQFLKDKAYRYFSPEYRDEWEDNQGNKYQDVLFGGGLTNRPFLKNILPLNLSEVWDQRDNEDKEGKLTRKQLCEFLGLAEDATDEQVNAKLAEAGLNTPKPEPEPKPTGLSETQQAELVKLAEQSPTIKALVDSNKALSDNVAILMGSNRLMEVNSKLSEIGGKKRTLSPESETKLREAVIAAPKALGDKMLDAVKEIIEGGIVELGERGSVDPEDEGAGNHVSEFMKLSENRAKEMLKDNPNASMAEALPVAMEQIAGEQPKLYEGYRKGVYLREDD